MSPSSFNPDEFVRDVVNDVARQFQATMDGLLRSHDGRPVDEVKPALRAALRRIDIEADADEIQQWSVAISSGTRIVTEVE